MKQTITFGGLTVAAGEKASGFATVLDTGFQMPITVFNGAEEGKTVVVTSGIHGGEYPCIETAVELAQEIDPKTLSGQLIIFHPVNFSAFFARVSYVAPEDGKNINRLFPGNPEGTVSDKIAYVLTTEYLDKADFHVDLHGGDIHESLPPYVYYPGVAEEPVVAAAKAAAETFQAHYMVKSSATTGAYNSSAIRGVPSLLVELGGRGLWSQEEVQFYKNNLLNLFRFLNLVPGEVKMPEQQARLITKAEYLDANHSGCWYPLAELEERVKAGQTIGVIKDVFGTVLEEIVAEYDAIILFKTVSLAISKGDPIITYGV